MKQPEEQADTHFIFLGNGAAIDFVNTEVMQGGQLTELFQDTANVVRWAQEAGHTLEGKISANGLKTLKALRAALRELFQARIDNRSPSEQALATVNRHLAKHRTHRLLQFNSASGEFQLAPDDTATTLSALLAELAYEGGQLLSSSQGSNIKRCNNPSCALLFLDTSRTRRRRWCSMEICGNRAKVAKHYRKQTQ